MIYFIRADHGGPVKIGHVEDESLLDSRLSTLQVGSSTELYVDAVLPGDRKHEKQLHERFAAGRIRGEWFRPDTPGLPELIGRAVHLEALSSCEGRWRHA